MYRNLEAELARRGITRAELAKVLGINIATMSEKLNYPRRLRLCEAQNIRDKLFPDLSIDYLFSTERTA